MYGKIFDSIYDGSLATDWKTMVVFQQLIVLSDPNGVVDMTIDAISRRTNMPRDMISDAIEKLQQPDSDSRSADEDGRRIILIDEYRDWGWLLVNHKQYREHRSSSDRAEYQREYYQKRKELADSTPSTVESTNPTASTHTEATTEATTDKEATTKKSSAPAKKLLVVHQKPTPITVCVYQNEILADARFNRFWEVVHSRKGREKAKAAFQRACKRLEKDRERRALSDLELTAVFITERMTEFAATPEANPTDRTPILPATWLNEGRYDDDPETWKRVDSRGGSNQKPTKKELGF